MFEEFTQITYNKQMERDFRHVGYQAGRELGKLLDLDESQFEQNTGIPPAELTRYNYNPIINRFTEIPPEKIQIRNRSSNE